MITPCEKCDACGRLYQYIYWVPSHVWKKIKPLPTEMGGLLCVDCVHSRALSAGYTIRFSGSDEWWGEDA